MIIVLSTGLKGKVAWSGEFSILPEAVVSAISTSNQQVVSNSFKFLFSCSFCAYLVSEISPS